MMTFRCAMRLLLAVAIAACTGNDPATLLPATAASGVPMGNPAGPADRGAWLVANPFDGNASAREDGRRLFRNMNCVYCHGRSGEGGMGPSLVDSEWLFGEAPVDRFLSVFEGRPRGMPSYGVLLPDEEVWKLVTYIDHLQFQRGEPGRAGGQPPAATRQSQEPGGRK